MIYNIFMNKDKVFSSIEDLSFLTTMANHIPGMFAYWNNELRCSFANSKYHNVFGKTSVEMNGIHIQELLGPELFAANEPYIIAALNGENQQFERQMIKRDGEILYVLAQYIAHIEKGETLGFFALITDISEQKLLQKELIQKSSLLQATNLINSMLVKATNNEIIMNEICRILVEEGKFSMSWIGVVDETTKFVSPVSIYGDKFDYVKSIKVFVDTSPEKDGPISLAIRDNKPLVVQDAMNDPRLSQWATQRKKTSWNSSIAIPILNSTSRAILVVYTETKNYFGTQEIAMLEAVVANLNIFIARKQSEEKLKESEELWHFALEGAGDGIWDWNIKTDTVFFSKHWKGMIGFLDHEFENTFDNWKNRLHPEDLEKTLEKIKLHFEEREAFSIEFRMLCKDLNYKWILSRGKVVSRDDDGKPIRMVGTHADLSQIKNSEQQLLQTAKLASLGEMSAGIAHEINNPLTVIAGSVRLLSRYAANPEKLVTITENIQKSSERITRIVQGLKKFSRNTEGDNYTKQSLAGIIKEAIILTDANAKGNNTLVTYEISAEPFIYCDEIEIEQVLINLINNAIDAIKDKKEKWIKIELLNSSNQPLLRITDSGDGIPEKILNKIFDPFFTTKPVGEGTGLGLSVSKGILEKHNATITIPPNAKNTCFEILFPKSDI